jgi:hypothetical protein
LLGLLDVAPEKNESARLHAAEHGSGIRIKFRSRHTDQKKLSDIVRHGGVRNQIRPGLSMRKAM